MTKLTKESQPEHGFTAPLYSQATVDILRAQIEAAEAANDRLSGMKFSDRMHAALVARAEAAEADALRYHFLRSRAAECEVGIPMPDGFVYAAGDQLDETIDAAIVRTTEKTK